MTEPATAEQADGTRAVLADGSVVTVRRIGVADRGAVRRLHQELPDQDRYTRFFGTSARAVDQYAASITSGSDRDYLAVGAFSGNRLLGVASWAVLAERASAEVAFAVAHDTQVHGVATLLFEELVSLARERGITKFKAMVLVENSAMVRMLSGFGLPVTRRLADGVVDVEISLEDGPDYRSALLRREQHADEASLHALLRPASVVVVGAGRAPESVGHALLRNIVRGGYTGRLWAVNPHAREIAGVPCFHAIAELPAAPDLAVLCVPAAAIADAARECGRRGARGIVVVTSGLSGKVAVALRDTVRQFGMRMVGPNCLGVVNTDPGVGLNATFARTVPVAGEVGVVTQSGGVAISLLGDLDRLGLGVSSLVSTGDKYDVSGNDLLLWWAGETRTRAAVLYLESFGNPRKFALLCRKLAATKPILAVRPPATSTAQQAATSHTAALATPAVTADALYRQAGVLAVDRLSDLPETLAVLLDQPLPAGNRVAVISNAGGAGIIAADALSQRGLVLPPLSPYTIAATRALLPPPATAANPMDTTAVVAEATFTGCVRSLLRDTGIDAVIAIAAPTAVGDPLPAILACAADAKRAGKPLLAVHLAQPSAVVRLATPGAAEDAPAIRVPCYADPVAAVAALRRAVDRQEWLARPQIQPDRPARFDAAAAQDIARTQLAAHPGGGWLDPEQSLRLLGSVGVPVVPGVVSTTVDEAVLAAERAGGPVALKAVAEGLLHKSHGGGVALNVSGGDAVRKTWAGWFDSFGARLRGVFVQPMAQTDCAELLVGVKNNPTFGALLVFGAGGVHTDDIADRTARLAPLTAADLDELVRGLRCSATVFGDHRADENAVRDVLLRVSLLAEAVPQVAELDINPLLAGPNGCLAVDARIRLAAAVRFDPLLRHLHL